MLKTKHDEPCLQKAADDEPIWVLRGQDATAPFVIRAWARHAEANGVNGAKVETALNDAADMEAWQQAHPDRVKLPD